MSVFDWLLQEELSDVNIEHLKRGLVEFLVSKALDHKDHHRELTSVLISDLYGKVLSSKDMMEGFDDVLSHLSDLIIDTPDATTVGISLRVGVVDMHIHLSPDGFTRVSVSQSGCLMMVFSFLTQIWSSGSLLLPHEAFLCMGVC